MHALRSFARGILPSVGLFAVATKGSPDLNRLRVPLEWLVVIGLAAAAFAFFHLGIKARRQAHGSSPRYSHFLDSQPRALYVLGVVQACERFAFFAVFPLFVLYLHHHLGISEDRAVLLLGSVQAASYLGGLPGGWLADSLGRRGATLLGTVLLTLGYAAVAVDRPTLLWLALGLLVVGHSFFKTGLYALASGLYARGDRRREGGFLLLHFMLNVGAMLGPLCAEWARARWGWPTIFRCSALGMILGTGCLLVVCFFIHQGHAGNNELTVPQAPVGDERKRVRAIWFVCTISLVFWLTAQQAGTSLSFFAERHTAQVLHISTSQFEVRPGHFAALHALLVLLLLPLLSWLFRSLRRRRIEPSTPAKMLWGYLATAVAFAVIGLACLRGGDTDRVAATWLSGCYVFLTLAELLLAPTCISLITQLAPPTRASRLLGLWFASAAVGNWLVGWVGLLWNRWPHHRYFLLLALLSGITAALLTIRLRRMEALVATAGTSQGPEATEPTM